MEDVRRGCEDDMRGCVEDVRAGVREGCVEDVRRGCVEDARKGYCATQSCSCKGCLLFNKFCFDGRAYTSLSPFFFFFNHKQSRSSTLKKVSAASLSLRSPFP